MTRHKPAVVPAEYPSVPGQVHPDLVRVWVLRALGGAQGCLTELRGDMPPAVVGMLRGRSWCEEGECDGEPCPVAVGLVDEVGPVPEDPGTVMRNASVVGRQLGLTDVQVLVLGLAAVAYVEPAVRDVVALLVYQGADARDVVARMLGADPREVREAMDGLAKMCVLRVGQRVVLDVDDDEDEEDPPW